MVDSTPLISVIVPVYKAEKYLDTCIASIASQTYSNLEILLINDGSPDRTPAICEDWAAKDVRIKVIHQKNLGAAAARNKGVAAARGELLGFVDADDWISADAYEVMQRNMERESADVSAIGMTDVRDSHFMTKGSLEHYTVGGAEEALIYVNASPYGNAPCMSRGVCDKLYRKELFKGIQFPDGWHVEDAPVTYQILEKIDRFVFDPAPKYFYRHNEESRSNATVVDIETIDYFESLYRLMLKKFPAAAPYVLYVYLENLVRVYQASLRITPSSRYHAFRKQALCSLRQYVPIVKAQVNPDIIPLGRKTRFAWGLLSVAPAVYNTLYLMYRKLFYRFAVHFKR
ncbi:hypothetical protein KIM372_17660 [Bombiscardovia nodaiensis]|uniref:Glycosyltransferase 2-like domain-containing protein n=1 Tax=Bombiscardovia nodaiensis TaxID=2932181 RepID=A0ABN6SDX5_9BIFI|nr:hypothetical protein KIM372_17660 [Bombiscardovia nodaiensis]